MTVIESTVTTLAEYADAVLAVCSDALALTEAGVQDRVYVSPSIPAIDCEQLTVYVAGIAEGQTSPFGTEETALRGKFGNIIMVTYVIDSVRCTTNPQSLTVMPSADALTRVAHAVQNDMFALWNEMRHAHNNGEIFDTCLGVHFDGIRPLREQGGYVGCEMTIRASIPGIPSV